MFGIKTKILDHLNKKFTAKGLSGENSSFIEQKLLIYLAKKELKHESRLTDLQSPVFRKTNQYASLSTKAISDYMPNNLGNWSIKRPHSFTTKLEKELVEHVKKNYYCNDSIGGHFGSGSTEGNLYSSWIGRNFLIKKHSFKPNEIILIKSSLAHYSLDKAADIINVSIAKANIDKETFNLNPAELIKQFELLYDKGFRGFLLPLTLGYTVTGTDDDYNAICNLTEEFEKTHKDSRVFIWLDAAFSGISKIYTHQNFKPFLNKNIQLISSDFHKFLAVPYPSNIILYRKKLLQYIKKDIPYIDQFDTTLLGSRPGNNVFATWLSLVCLSKNKIEETLLQAMKEKSAFLSKIEDDKSANFQIINNSASLQAAIISHDKKSVSYLQSRYGLKSIKYNLLIANKEKSVNIAKLYFLPKF
jgi:glutamate/tyrosine decarboxylase-like PLP-dependent enzyme